MSKGTSITLDVGAIISAKATHWGVRDEYAPKFGRQHLTLWSGPFSSNFEGWATELPKHNGFMVDLEYRGKVRVECPSPRDDTNWQDVDSAINDALKAAGYEPWN